MIHEAGLHFNVLGLLQDQQRSYTAELGRAHQTLSKLYRKLARIEHDLSQRHELGLTRKEKKKLQWSRSEIKRTVLKLEYQQASLHEYLRQCGSLMAPYASQTWTPWTMSMPSTACQAIAIPFAPFTLGLPWMSSNSSSGDGTQYWDLSMLPDRSQSPLQRDTTDSAWFGPPRSAFEHMSGQGRNSLVDQHHVFAHEIMAEQRSSIPLGNLDRAAAAMEARASLSWFKFPAADMQLVGHTEGGAMADTHGQEDTLSHSQSSHRRRLSENAIQIIEARLATNATARKQSCSHKRGISWAGTTTATLTAMPLIENDNEIDPKTL